MIRVESRRNISAWQLVCNLLISSALHYFQHGDKEGGLQGAQATYIFLMAVTIWLSKFKLYLTFLPIWEKLRPIFDPLLVSLLANLGVQYFWIEMIKFMATTVCKLSEYFQGKGMEYVMNNFLITSDCDGGLINFHDLLACLTLVWVASSLQLVGSFRLPAFFRLWSSSEDDDDDDDYCD